jgi:amino acid transporter
MIGATEANVDDAPQSEVAAESHPTTLRAGALGLPEVMFQAVGHISPGVGMVSSMAFIVVLAGVATPITIVLGGVICLLVAIGLTQLASKIQGAGGYFQYVSRTVGPRSGFITAWLYFLYDPLVVGALWSYGGGVTQAAMQARWGWAVPWWVFSIVGIALVGFLSWRGIRLSGKVLLFAGLAEIAIFVALGVAGLIHPGPGGVSLAPFNPANAPNFNAVYLGIIFSVLTFTGFESVAPLAEETWNPRRYLPIALVGSVVIVMLYYLISSWGILVGWGLNDMPGFASSPDPIFALAYRLWGWAWFLVLLAFLNSVLAVCLACHNAGTRVFFAMGRTGVFPHSLARLHPKYQTPVAAITLQTAISLATALGLGAWIGAEQNFFFVGIVLTLGLIVVYSMGNLGIFRLYWRSFRGEFNIWLHLIIPLVSTVALIWAGYKSIQGLNPFDPKSYLDWTVTVTAGWFVVGFIVLGVFRLRKHDAWLLRATEAVALEEISQPKPGTSV